MPRFTTPDNSSLSSGELVFCSGELFRPLVEQLLNHDVYLVLADYQAYIDCQDRIDAAYRDSECWTRLSIMNVARMGKFSSDRSIRDYCENIWLAPALPGNYDTLI